MRFRSRLANVCRRAMCMVSLTTCSSYFVNLSPAKVAPIEAYVKAGALDGLLRHIPQSVRT